LAWRYPLPENTGIVLDVDRGNIVKAITPKSPAFAVGLRAGDEVRCIGNVPIHSFGDVQFALDISPATGTVGIRWQRSGKEQKAAIALEEGWRKTDLSWRPSMRRLLPSARLYGDDLTPEEKKTLGLAPAQLAFRQKDSVPTQAKNAGIQSGDIIIGVDDQTLQLDVTEFQHYIRSHYLIGDKPVVNMIRDGKRLRRVMQLTP
jgi:S1-C subfamily serine protease